MLTNITSQLSEARKLFYHKTNIDKVLCPKLSIQLKSYGHSYIEEVGILQTECAHTLS